MAATAILRGERGPASGIIVMGVDPAYRTTGWAVLRHREKLPSLMASGTIPASGKTVPRALLSIGNEFRSVVEQWSPRLVVLEQPGRWMFRRDSNRRSIELMAMVRGIMLAVCASRNVTALTVDFQEARARVFGKAILKPEVKDRLLTGRFLSTTPEPTIGHDVADAIVMALYPCVVGDPVLSPTNRGGGFLSS